MSTKTATKTKTAPKTVECSCYSIAHYEQDQLEFHSCGAQTRRTFAPGHDAKLKGTLIRLHRAGLPYVRIVNGTRQEIEPMQHAKLYGWGHLLTAQAKRGVKLPTEKAAKATEARPVEDLPLHQPQAKANGPVEVKVGRWWYDVVSYEVLEGGGFEIEYTRKGHDAAAKTTVKSVEVADRIK